MSLPQAAAAAAVALRTAQRWLAQYQASGLPGLARTPRSRRGRRRFPNERVTGGRGRIGDLLLVGLAGGSEHDVFCPGEVECHPLGAAFRCPLGQAAGAAVEQEVDMADAVADLGPCDLHAGQGRSAATAASRSAQARSSG